VCASHHEGPNWTREDNPLRSLLPLFVAPFVGSFLGVLIRRYPRSQPVALDRSRCETCGHALSPAEMVPIISFLLLRGRCRLCRAPIARFHLIIEIGALAIAAWAAAVQIDPLGLWLSCILGWSLLALAWIDSEHMLMPDVLTLPLILFGMAATLLQEPEDMLNHAVGAAIGYLAFRVIAWLYKSIRGHDGLGQGDAKMLGAAGAWVSWAALPVLVLTAALAALAMTLVAVAAGRRIHGRTALPFGPFLAGALWIIWLYRPS